jgi:hypothetical protein
MELIEIKERIFSLKDTEFNRFELWFDKYGCDRGYGTLLTSVTKLGNRFVAEQRKPYGFTADYPQPHSC